MASIAIYSDTDNIYITDTMQIIAVATYTDASTSVVTTQVNWISSIDTVVIIDTTTGLITSVDSGISSITANLNGIFSDSIVVNSKFITWQKMYGSSGEERYPTLQLTSDGGYIVIGNLSYTITDYSIIKLNSNGDSVWYKNLNQQRTTNYSPDIIQASDGCYIVACSNSNNYSIIKLDSNGDSIWNKMYGGTNNDFPTSIKQTSDGGYIVVGTSNSRDIQGVTNSGGDDLYIIKLDLNGDIVWHKMYVFNNNHRYVKVIQQVSDGGYIVGGASNIIKLDSNGDSVWLKIYDGFLGISSLKQTTDGGYIVAGNSATGGNNYSIIKLDSNGDSVWLKRYGTRGPSYWVCIEQTVDGGYIVGGSEDTDQLTFNYYFLKLDSNGNSSWENRIGESNSFEEFGIIKQTSDGGYIVVGSSNSTSINGLTNSGMFDYHILKLDSGGNL
jgi:hypothetical protein